MERYIVTGSSKVMDLVTVLSTLRPKLADEREYEIYYMYVRMLNLQCTFLAKIVLHFVIAGMSAAERWLP